MLISTSNTRVRTEAALLDPEFSSVADVYVHLQYGLIFPSVFFFPVRPYLFSSNYSEFVKGGVREPRHDRAVKKLGIMLGHAEFVSKRSTTSAHYHICRICRILGS